MLRRFVIVKLFDENGVKYNDRKYYMKNSEAFVDNLKHAKYHAYSSVVQANMAIHEIKEKGVFQIEEIFIKN